MRNNKGGSRRRKRSGKASGCENGSGFSISLLMRGVTRYTFITVNDDEYLKREFYMININKNNSNGVISTTANKFCDPQYEYKGSGSKLFRVGGSRIYNLASVNVVDIDDIPDNIRGIHCLRSVSWVDLNETPPLKWRSGPTLECYAPCSYACLNDNIYCLAPGNLSEPRGLNTTNNDGWLVCTPTCPVQDLHPDLDLCFFQNNGNMLADPLNKRIIFQLKCVICRTPHVITPPIIYSWYPEANPPHWDVVTRDIDPGTWKNNFPTLVDDFIFFHYPNTFSAFHLKHNKWMKVSLSKRHFWPTHLVYRKVDHMFYLGESRLCLVCTHRIFNDDDGFVDPYFCGIEVFFDVFHIQPDQSNSLHVTIAHSFTASITLDGIAIAADFLPLEASFDA